MAFIPEGAKWYLAELVQELRVAGDSRNVIWRNLTLVRADSPEHAYQEALRLGRDAAIPSTTTHRATGLK
jgi:hypothetical protein